MSTQRTGAVLVCALAFVTLFGYALARPSSESLFLEQYGSEGLPLVWAAVAVCAIAVVALYNRAAAQRPLGDVMLGSIAVSAVTLLALLVLQRAGVRAAAFLLYVWKDVHIVVLLEALWSFANLVFPSTTARWVYGVFCAFGSLGGISGNLLTGKLALMWGTHSALWCVLPLFLVELALAWQLARAAGDPKPAAGARLSDLNMLRDSPYLGWMLLLIGLVQVAITLIDYTFNQALAAAYPSLDVRTATIGRVYAAIDAASLVLQLLTGVVLRFVGLRFTLLMIPATLACIAAGFALHPRFALGAITKMASKVFDYSLFRAAKEMLYLPLGYAEKTRGKALVDVLTYRVAKGGASLLLAGLLALGLGAGVPWLTLALIAAWLGVTVVVTRRHRDASSDGAGGSR